jgi:hypothetical protein
MMLVGVSRYKLVSCDSFAISESVFWTLAWTETTSDRGKADFHLYDL